MICTCLPSGRETTRPAPLTFGIGSASRQLAAISIRASAVVLTGTVSSIVIGSTGFNDGCRSSDKMRICPKRRALGVVGYAEVTFHIHHSSITALTAGYPLGRKFRSPETTYVRLGRIVAMVILVDVRNGLASQ